jgi:hypothetical protein
MSARSQPSKALIISVLYECILLKKTQNNLASTEDKNRGQETEENSGWEKEEQRTGIVE